MGSYNDTLITDFLVGKDSLTPFFQGLRQMMGTTGGARFSDEFIKGIEKTHIAFNKLTAVDNATTRFKNFEAELSKVGLKFDSIGRLQNIFKGGVVSAAEAMKRIKAGPMTDITSKMGIKQLGADTKNVVVGMVDSFKDVESVLPSLASQIKTVNIDVNAIRNIQRMGVQLGTMKKQGADVAQEIGRVQTVLEGDTKLMKSFNIGLREGAKSFDMFNLSLLFGGMMLQRAGSMITKFFIPSMDQLQKLNDTAAKKVMGVSAAFEFLKISLFETVSQTPMFQALVEWIVKGAIWIAEFAQKHEDVTAMVIAIGGLATLLGTGFVIASFVGQVDTVFKGAYATLVRWIGSDGKSGTWGNAWNGFDLLKKTVGVISIVWGIKNIIGDIVEKKFDPLGAAINAALVGFGLKIWGASTKFAFKAGVWTYVITMGIELAMNPNTLGKWIADISVGFGYLLDFLTDMSITIGQLLKNIFLPPILKEEVDTKWIKDWASTIDEGILTEFSRIKSEGKFPKSFDFMDDVIKEWDDKSSKIDLKTPDAIISQFDDIDTRDTRQKLYELFAPYQIKPKPLLLPNIQYPEYSVTPEQAEARIFTYKKVWNFSEEPISLPPIQESPMSIAPEYVKSIINSYADIWILPKNPLILQKITVPDMSTAQADLRTQINTFIDMYKPIQDMGPLIAPEIQAPTPTAGPLRTKADIIPDEKLPGIYEDQANQIKSLITKEAALGTTTFKTAGERIKATLALDDERTKLQQLIPNYYLIEQSVRDQMTAEDELGKIHSTVSQEQIDNLTSIFAEQLKSDDMTSTMIDNAIRFGETINTVMGGTETTTGVIGKFNLFGAAITTDNEYFIKLRDDIEVWASKPTVKTITIKYVYESTDSLGQGMSVGDEDTQKSSILG